MSLNDTALSFARECLGWADAKVRSHDPEAEIPRLVVLSARAKADTLFAATDLKDVEATVRPGVPRRGSTTPSGPRPGTSRPRPSSPARGRPASRSGSVPSATRTRAGP